MILSNVTSLDGHLIVYNVLDVNCFHVITNFLTTDETLPEYIEKSSINSILFKKALSQEII